MCGIVGATSERNVTGILIEGLRRLEYRGYDSAGVAVVSGGVLKRERSVGKVQKLADLVAEKQVNGPLGIAPISRLSTTASSRTSWSSARC